MGTNVSDGDDAPIDTNVDQNGETLKHMSSFSQDSNIIPTEGHTQQNIT